MENIFNNRCPDLEQKENILAKRRPSRLIARM
jgi:hypothetical protein